MTQEAPLKPPHQRPETPDFWDKRFAEGVTPWVHGGVPPELETFVGRHPDGMRTLIPGCGHAFEAGFLAARGWDVTALDFSPTAIATAREVLGDWPGQLLCADFFSFAPPSAYDLVYERAFLCALPRKLWPGYGPRLADLVRPGGLLAGFFFFSDAPKGPPFGISPEALAETLTPWFELIEDAPASAPIPVFAEGEHWQVWRRR